MLQRVADEVGGHLRDPLGIHLGPAVTVAPGVDDPRGHGRLMLAHHSFHERLDIRGLTLDHDAAGQARARQIEHVLDHAAHVAAARQHARRRFLSRGLGGARLRSCAEAKMALNGLRRSCASKALNISFRRSVSVRSLQFLSELLALAVQLKEHVRLVLEDVRLDGLVDEVDGARFVALEEALLPRGRRRSRR